MEAKLQLQLQSNSQLQNWLEQVLPLTHFKDSSESLLTKDWYPKLTVITSSKTRQLPVDHLLHASQLLPHLEKDLDPNSLLNLINLSRAMLQSNK
jgi:hypothetical protein